MRTLPSAVFASLLVAAAACNSDSGQAPGTNQPRVAIFRADTASTLLLSGFSGFRTPAKLVVTDEATWSDVWAQAQASYEPKDPAPGIDFGEDGVIVVALGTDASARQALNVDSVEYFDGSQKVWLTRRVVDGSCAVVAVVTQPVHIVRAPRPLNSVTFEETSRLITCPR